MNIYKTIYPMVRFKICYLYVYIYIYSSVFVGKHPIVIFPVRSENVARFINLCFMEVSCWYQVLITWGKLPESKNARVYHQEDSAQFSATSQWFLLGIFTKNHWRGHLGEGSPLGLGSLNVGCPWYDWVISPTVYPFPSPQDRSHPAETPGVLWK